MFRFFPFISRDEGNDRTKDLTVHNLTSCQQRHCKESKIKRCTKTPRRGSTHILGVHHSGPHTKTLGGQRFRKCQKSFRPWGSPPIPGINRSRERTCLDASWVVAPVLWRGARPAAVWGGGVSRHSLAPQALAKQTPAGGSWIITLSAAVSTRCTSVFVPGW